MEICADCAALIGSPAEARPHRALRMGQVELGMDRDEEEWFCSDCGTRLFRFSKGSTLSRNSNLGKWQKY